MPFSVYLLNHCYLKNISGEVEVYFGHRLSVFLIWSITCLLGSCPPASFKILKAANIVLAADRFEGANVSISRSIFYMLLVSSEIGADFQIYSTTRNSKEEKQAPHILL